MALALRAFYMESNPAIPTSFTSAFDGALTFADVIFL